MKKFAIMFALWAFLIAAARICRKEPVKTAADAAMQAEDAAYVEPARPLDVR